MSTTATSAAASGVQSATQAASADAELFRALWSSVYGLPPARSVRVLDVGCGRGELVQALRAQGYDAVGTDLAATLGDNLPAYITPIQVRVARNETASTSYTVTDAYRLPFEDCSFAAVVSSQTLEHVQDKQTFFAEIERVLVSGGATAHLFPSRYYLPWDPHLLVPFVPMMWPHVPECWLALFALLGVRNQHQTGMPWRQVVRRNADYCRHALSYWPLTKYERLLTSIGFRDVQHQFAFGVRHAPGGYARLMRRPAIFALARLFPALQQLRNVLLTAVKP